MLKTKLVIKFCSKLRGMKEGVITRIADRIRGNRITWRLWADLHKEVYRGKTYAKIGERYYSKHAIDYMTPENMRGVLNIPKGQELRGVPSIVVEEAIRYGSKSSVVRNGEERIIHTLGDIKVITSVDSKIVITLRKESVK